MPTYIASIYVEGASGLESHTRMIARAVAPSEEAFRIRILNGLLSQVPVACVSFGPIGVSKRELTPEQIDCIDLATFAEGKPDLV